MTSIKEVGANLKSNALGAVVGALAGFFGTKKLAKVQNKWVLVGATVLGAVVGATIQSKFKAKKSAPTVATVTK